MARAYGVLRVEGYSERALFVIDTKGCIQYIDIHDIDDQPNNEVVLDELRKLEPDLAWKVPRMEPKPAELPVEKTSGKVVMYCTRWCPDCRKARSWFSDRNIEFTEVDVYSDPSVTEQVREWGKGYVISPMFDIDGTIIVDWKPDQMAELLKGRLGSK